MSTNQRRKVAYGLSQPYFNTPQLPIVAMRSPLVTDYAEVGTLWIDESTAPHGVWILTDVANNAAQWVRIDNSTANTTVTWAIYAGVGPEALAANYGYYLTNAAAVTLTLPAVAALGSQIFITTANASAANAGFAIDQNAGQYILYAGISSTVGAAGSLQAINLLQRSLVLQLICTVANTEFTVASSNFVPNLV